MFDDERYVSGDDVQVPAHLNFGKFILHRLRSMVDEVAFENADTGEQLTYRQFKQYSVDLAVALTQLGVAKGDVVALGSERRNEFFPTVLAIILTGASYTPYELNGGRSVLRHKMNITKPKYLICSKLFWETNSEVVQSFECIEKIITLDDIPSDAVPVQTLISKHHNVDLFEPVHVQGQEDVAFVLYSSGTTGMPKGVQLSHLSCIISTLPDDFADESLKTALITNTWYHNYDNFMTFKFLNLGRKIVYFNADREEALMRCLETHKLLKESTTHNAPDDVKRVVTVEILHIVARLPTKKECIAFKSNINAALISPTTVTLISKVDEKTAVNLDSLKVIYSRSFPLHVKTIEKLKQRFPTVKKVLQGYGMTEAGEPASENWGTKGPKPGSVGCASPGITLKVVNPDTQEVLGPNQRGEVRVRGPVLMKGYIGVDLATVLDEEGFFKTGDLGYYDEDRYFFIVERLKDIICYGGYKIAPLELETILLLHPDVKEAGVVGKPVPVFSEEPAAFVVREPGSSVTEQQLLDFVKDEVPPYMQLRGGIRFVSEIPRNMRGKIMRNKLREMLKDCN